MCDDSNEKWSRELEVLAEDLVEEQTKTKIWEIIRRQVPSAERENLPFSEAPLPFGKEPHPFEPEG